MIKNHLKFFEEGITAQVEVEFVIFSLHTQISKSRHKFEFLHTISHNYGLITVQVKTTATLKLL